MDVCEESVLSSIKYYKEKHLTIKKVYERAFCPTRRPAGRLLPEISKTVRWGEEREEEEEDEEEEGDDEEEGQPQLKVTAVQPPDV